MKNRAVSQADFLRELDHECAFQSSGGTSYRQRTAAMARELAGQHNAITRFLNRDEAADHVRSAFPSADEERVQDASKMLNVIARNVQLRSTLPAEAAEYVRLKKTSQKPLKLMKQTKGK